MRRFSAMTFATVRKVLGMGLLLAASLTAVADNTPTPATAGRVPQPVIETARGGTCVEDPAFMRRNHMKLLRHQRDATVHTGVRNAPYALKDCIACHASKTTNSVTASDTNFCTSCHSYAAVSIDCFECHANKPQVKP